jgi:hypothetical protein
MLDYINADRAFFSEESGGAASLSWNPDLWTVAVAHSQDMCDRAYFEHDNKKGHGPQERAERAGYAYYVAENISVNKDVAATMHGLMAEPTCTGHRGNILTPLSVSVGIGIITCDNPRSEWHGYWIITQDFEWDFANSESPYCQSARTSCELPSDPVSTASEHCSAQANSWGWCSYDPDEIMDESWGCPRD